MDQDELEKKILAHADWLSTISDSLRQPIGSTVGASSLIGLTLGFLRLKGILSGTELDNLKSAAKQLVSETLRNDDLCFEALRWIDMCFAASTQAQASDSSSQ